MMLLRITYLLGLLLLAGPTQAQLGKLINKAKGDVESLIGGKGLSQDEAGAGLKEALNIGVDEAVSFLSATDGYYRSPYKILLPEEAQRVVSKLKMVPGFENVEEKLVEKMNRAAELAAVKAKPIFLGAIKRMTFGDALNILTGEEDAATRYLERTTSDPLFAEFQPVIQQALDEVNAREYWRTAVTAYNKLPLVKPTNPELDAYVTERAMVGLFSLVEKKERGIRENPALRTSDLLKKVFAKQDRG